MTPDHFTAALEMLKGRRLSVAGAGYHVPMDGLDALKVAHEADLKAEYHRGHGAADRFAQSLRASRSLPVVGTVGK